MQSDVHTHNQCIDHTHSHYNQSQQQYTAPTENGAYTEYTYDNKRNSYDFNVKDTHEYPQQQYTTVQYNYPESVSRHTSTPKQDGLQRQSSTDKLRIHQKLQELQRQQEFLIQQLLPDVQSDVQVPTSYQQNTYDIQSQYNNTVPVETVAPNSTESVYNDTDSHSSPEYSIHDTDSHHSDNIIHSNSSTSVDNAGKRIFYCDTCMKSFYHKGTLRRHLRIHTGEKPYACTVCQRAFNQKIALITHIRTHTGEKPYECNVCTQQFAYKNNLTAHLRKHSELGEKPYQCDICNKAFGYRGTLERHKKLHQHELNTLKKKLKKYVCTYANCNKKFSKQSLLLQHQTIHFAAPEEQNDSSEQQQPPIDLPVEHQQQAQQQQQYNDSITHELIPTTQRYDSTATNNQYDTTPQYNNEPQFNEHQFDQQLNFHDPPTNNNNWTYNPSELEYLFGYDSNFHSNPSITTIAMH